MSKFEIVLLRRYAVVSDIELTTLIKPPVEYLQKVHPSLIISTMYPEDAVTFSESEEDEEPEIVDIDENQLLGYNLTVPKIQKIPKTYCLVLDMITYVFPIAYSEDKKELEVYRDCLDITTLGCRVSLMTTSEKHSIHMYSDIRDLIDNYLRDSELEELERDTVRDFKEDLKAMKEDSLEIEGDEYI
jgi:hypothetical protein